MGMKDDPDPKRHMGGGSEGPDTLGAPPKLITPAAFRDGFGRATAIGEVLLPGFASPPGIPGKKVSVEVHMLQGTFRLGTAKLISPDGDVQAVTYRGTPFIHPRDPAAYFQRLRNKIFRADLDGVTEADLRPGQYLIQEENEGAE